MSRQPGKGGRDCPPADSLGVLRHFLSPDAFRQAHAAAVALARVARAAVAPPGGPTRDRRTNPANELFAPQGLPAVGIRGVRFRTTRTPPARPGGGYAPGRRSSIGPL